MSVSPKAFFPQPLNHFLGQHHTDSPKPFEKPAQYRAEHCSQEYVLWNQTALGFNPGSIPHPTEGLNGVFTSTP